MIMESQLANSRQTHSGASQRFDSFTQGTVDATAVASNVVTQLDGRSSLGATPGNSAGMSPATSSHKKVTISSENQRESFCSYCDAFHDPHVCSYEREESERIMLRAPIQHTIDGDQAAELFDTPNNTLGVSLARLFGLLRDYVSPPCASDQEAQGFSSFMASIGASIAESMRTLKEAFIGLLKPYVLDVFSEVLRSFFDDAMESVIHWFYKLITSAKSALLSIAPLCSKLLTLLHKAASSGVDIAGGGMIMFCNGLTWLFMCVYRMFQPSDYEKVPDDLVPQGKPEVLEGFSTPFYALAKVFGSHELDNFADKCRSVNNVINLSEKCIKIGSSMLNWIFVQYCAMSANLSASEYTVMHNFPGGSEFVEAYRVAMSEENLRACKTDRSAQDRVNSLKVMVDNMTIKMPLRIDPAVRDAFSFLRGKVHSQFSLNISYCTGETKDRVEPVGVSLMGPPGIGKDTVLRFILNDLSKAFGVANQLHTKNSASKYYSNFVGQPFLLLSEFQAVEPAQNLQNIHEVSEIINIINVSPHLLVVESEPLKSVSYATYHVVFLTTNRFQFAPYGIHDMDAFHRRVPIRVVPICKKGNPIVDIGGWGSLQSHGLKVMNTMKPCQLQGSDFDFLLLDKNSVFIRRISYAELVRLIVERRHSNEVKRKLNVQGEQRQSASPVLQVQGLEDEVIVSKVPLENVLFANEVISKGGKEPIDDGSTTISEREYTSDEVLDFFDPKSSGTDLSKGLACLTLVMSLSNLLIVESQFVTKLHSLVKIFDHYEGYNVFIADLSRVFMDNCNIDGFYKRNSMGVSAYVIQSYMPIYMKLLGNTYNEHTIDECHSLLCKANSDNAFLPYGIMPCAVDPVYITPEYTQFVASFFPVLKNTGEERALSRFERFESGLNKVIGDIKARIEKVPIFKMVLIFSFSIAVAYATLDAIRVARGLIAKVEPVKRVTKEKLAPESDEDFLIRANVPLVAGNARQHLNRRVGNGSRSSHANLSAEGAIDERCKQAIDAVVNHNCAHFRFFNVATPNIEGSMYGIFLVGDVAIMPHHASVYLNKYDTVSISCNWNPGVIVVSTSSIRTAVPERSYDFMLLKIRNYPARPNIIKHIPNKEDLGRLTMTEIALVKPGLVKGGAPRSHHYCVANYVDSSVGIYRVADEKFSTTGFFRYQVNTEKGDCGSPIFIVNNSFFYKLGAIHTVADLTNKQNMGQALYADILLGLLNKFDNNLYLVPQSYFGELVVDTEKPPPEGVPVIPNHVYIGRLDKKFAVNTVHTKTKISRTYFEKELLDGALLPAVEAFKHLPPGQDLVLTNLANKARMHHTGNARVYSLVWDALFGELLSTSTQPTFSNTVLSFDEAVNGVDGEPYLGPLPKTTSVGTPDASIYNSHVKKPILNDPERFSDLEFNCTKLREKLDEGVPPTVYTLFMKDEPRPVEKIAKASVRLVYGCPMTTLIVFRQLFGPFLAWVMANHVHNHVAVGINPTSRKWNVLAESLLKFGNKMIDFDVESFDYNQPPECLEGFPHIVNRWAADDPLVQRQRINAAESNTSAFMAYGDLLYQRNGNVNSGNGATAVVNSFITINWILFAWYYVMLELGETKLADPSNFFKHCGIVTFGDDNIISFSDYIFTKFNPTKIRDVMQRHGVTLTDPVKKVRLEGDVPYKTLEECLFLKRGFVFNKDLRMYIAPLELKSIYKILSFYKRGEDDHTAISFNIETGLRELAFHGKDVYNEVVDKLVNVCKIRRLRFHLPSFETSYDRMIVGVMGEGLPQNIFEDLEAQGRDQEVSAQGAPLHGPEGPKVLLAFTVGSCNLPPAEADCKMPTKCRDCKLSHCDFYCWKVDQPYQAYYEDDDQDETPSFDYYNVTSDGFDPYDIELVNPLVLWYIVYYKTEMRICDVCFERNCSKDKEILYPGQPDRRLFPVLEAQASEKQEQILRFHDDGTALQYQRPGMTSLSFQQDQIREDRTYSTTSFVERVIDVANVTLSTGGTSAQNLGSWSFPAVLLANQMVVDKMRNFRHLRCDVVIKFLVNAAPTDTGMLWAYFSPYQSLVGTRGPNNQLACLTGFPGAYINIGPGAALELTIPYCSPLNAYDLLNQQGTIGEFSLAYVVPYRTVATTNATVHITCWATNVQLTVPTTTAGVLLQAQSLEKHTNVKNQTGTVSDVTGKFGSAFSSLGSVPVVGAVSSRIGSGLTTISNMAKAAGYCKEPNLRAITPVLTVPGRGFTWGTGLDDSIMLATEPNNHVEPHSGLFGTTRDEMDILTYAQREAICDYFTFSTATTVGSVLTSFPICPGYCFSGTSSTVDTTPLGFMAGPFELWRGSMIYTLRIAKNAFYSFRLRIAILPGVLFSAVTSATNFEACISEIVDFRNTTQYTITVHFNTPYVWLRNYFGTKSSSNVAFGSSDSCIGTLAIVLQTRVTATDNVPTTLDGFVTVRAGPDMRFAIPSFTNVMPTYGPFLLMSSNEKEEELNEFELIAQSAETTGTFSAVPQMDVQTTGLVPAEQTLSGPMVSSPTCEQLCIGESITSVRQLISRFAKYGPTITLTAGTSQAILIDPAYFGTGSANDYIPLWYYSWGYRFYRGSVSYKLLHAPSTVTTNVAPSRLYSWTTQTNAGAPSAPTASPTVYTFYPTCYAHITYPSVTPIHEITVPFYRMVPFSTITSTNTVFENVRPFVSVNATMSTGTTADMGLFIAAGDDFEYGYAIGTPRVTVLP